MTSSGNSEKRTLNEELDSSSKKLRVDSQENVHSANSVSLEEPHSNDAVPKNGETALEHSLQKSTDIIDHEVQLEDCDLIADVDPDEDDGEFDEAGAEEEDEELSFPTEQNVGITEYISDIPGFSGVFKQQYSDFIVREIDLDGNIIKLTDMSEPDGEEEEKVELSMLSADEVEKLKDLSDGVSKTPVSINVTDVDKDKRRAIHEAIRQHFKGLESTTKGTESEKCIEVSRDKGNCRRRHHGSNYTHFVLYKENTDTIDAVNKIATLLRFAPKILSYAGTKDRRAKTTQAFSAYRTEAKKLLGVNKRGYKIKIGNISYKDKEIRLGDLSGNHFSIILRKVQADDDLINKAMASLSSSGFINYFGMQRFGTTTIPTHAVGKAILCGEWKEAVDLILYPRYEDDDEGKAEALHIWSETRNAQAALDVMHFKNGIEGCLLRGLASHNENDYVSALHKIPRNIRLMYIHSYQSYIWNKVVSRRIKKYHMKVLSGDMVMTGDSSAANKIGFQRFSTMSPRHITEEEIDKPGMIYNVVLPLPGHSVILPNNEIKDWYDEFLKEDGMSFSSFKSNVKEYSLTGAYRKVFVVPDDLKWEVIQYNNVTSLLMLSDYDVLQGMALPPRDSVGEFKAIKMEFSLPPSTYATMAIREVLKIDTSISTQKKLTSECFDL